MKILKLTLGIFLILAAVGQIVPIYLITSGLLSGLAQTDQQTHFITKLIIHALCLIIWTYIGYKLIYSYKISRASHAKAT